MAAGFAFVGEIDWCKMKFYTAFLVLLYVMAASEAATKSATVSPTLSYWHHKLPTTSIPYSLKELISPLSFAETSELLADMKEDGGKNSKVSVSVGKGGVSIGTNPGKRVGVHVGDQSPFNYYYAASDSEILANPSLSSIFFLEKDLHSGTQVNLEFMERSSTPDSRVFFLPRRLADVIPFSSQKLSVALEKLNIDQGSDTALAMEQTLEECESPAISGEKKYCATSLESMIDFSTSTLRTNAVTVLATNVGKGQKYRITGFSFQSKPGSKSVACHRQTYAYAVYYCHETEHTSTTLVSLKGEDGSRGEGVAVCHTDTSGWNPQHLAFKVLNVKPGGATVCHFIPDDHVVWLPAN